VLLSLAIVHQAVYAVRYGPAIDEVMAGDHAYWPVLVVAAVAAGLLFGARWAYRLTFGALARSAASEPAPEQSRGFGREWLAIVGSLLPTVVVGFLALENTEHLLGHGHLDGLAVLWAPGAELTLPAIAGVVGAVALIGAFVRWQEVAIIALLRARRQGPRRRWLARRSAAPDWPVTAALVRLRLLAADNDRGRAPPGRAIATPA
jgi:hypothetical protein